MMRDKRKDIASKYANAVNNDGKKQSIVSGTGHARFARYAAEELKQIPKQAVEDSFGCGNPVAFGDIQPGQTVLDLGCGAGLDLLIAAEKVGSDGLVIGVDMTDAMLEKARKNVKAAGLSNVDVRKGHIEALPVENETVDWVISNCVINLSPQKDKVFAELARVLKPGGRMIVSDIVAQHIPWWIRKSGLLTAACAGGAIPETAYIKGLKAAGLCEVNIVARQYYQPEQMATVVLETLPRCIKNLSCCGKAVTRSLLTKLATPLSLKLWSARIAADKPAVH